MLVTGGSSGLGLEIARKHLVEGDNVCIVSRSKEHLAFAESELQTSNILGEVMFIPCNVAVEEEVIGLFEEISMNGYDVKIVYNAAGIGLFGEPQNVNSNMIHKLLEANFTGLIIVSTHALKAMNEFGGTIVNIMSSAAKKANPLETVYCGVKWGARGYTESLSVALKGSAIRVLAVYPGGMRTPFWTKDTGLSPDTSKFMDPKEVAEMIYTAVSDKNSLKVTELSIERK
jgi:short-subunit dehydrogenase